MRSSLVVLVGMLAISGCIEAAEAPSRSRSSQQAVRPQPSGAKAGAPVPVGNPGPEFVGASAGAADEAVRAAAATAKTDGRTLVVYVGASWCEPCQDFHRAVEAGQLDESLAGVRFLEFDADTDAERLVEAGYDGRLIPRFAMPGSDGRFGGTKIEGGIKGSGSVEHIMRRLEPMLASVAR
jgi:thiol-disulfide isomerase/thioredoxin